jgi:adenylate kinase family enzyme
MQRRERRPRRILVYGVTGSGKSTLAAQIAERLQLPWHPVDDLAWEPGWVQVPVDVQRARIAAICEGPEWVLDSGYGSWRDIALARADLVVGLDLPRRVSLSRLVRRTVRRLLSGTEVCNGNKESLRAVLGPESIVRWHFRSFSRKRRTMRQWHADPSGPPVVLLDSTAAVDHWLRTLPVGAAG